MHSGHRRLRTALLLALAGSAFAASAETRRCARQEVEYLIGGQPRAAAAEHCPVARQAVAGEHSRAVSVAAAVPTATIPSSSTTGTGPVIDDSERLQILSRELHRERRVLADMDQRTPVNARDAGETAERRHRHLADIAALEREIQRIPGQRPTP